MRVLAGDIGGTKTRLAVFEVEGVRLEAIVERAYPSRDYPSLDAIVEDFVAETGARGAQACFGIAGPVRGRSSETTNLPWIVDAQEMSGLGIGSVSLLNDLEATAWGIGALDDDDFHVLSDGEPDATGNRTVIAAGTGLGEAGLYWDGVGHRPFGSEGGHADFSPTNDLEYALLKFLAQRYGRVSWERVVSGPGLTNIHAFLLEHRDASTPEWLVAEMRAGEPSAAISKAALESKDAICVEALDLFVKLYGAEAGNHALKLMATGGVYVGGGIAPKIIEWLEAPGFLEAFWAKGRMERLMRSMPVKLILNDRAALLGPAVYVASRGH